MVCCGAHTRDQNFEIIQKIFFMFQVLCSIIELRNMFIVISGYQTPLCKPPGHREEPEISSVPLVTRPEELYNPHSTPHPNHAPLTNFAAPLSPIDVPPVVNSNGSNYASPLEDLPAARGTSNRGEMLSFVSKWAEGRSHVEYLMKIDRIPQKEEAVLVFQSLVIIWCVINNYPGRLLKKFTVYDFVNFVKKANGQYVCAVTDGHKYKFRRVLKFSEFEKNVMTFYFKRVRPIWISASDVLKESFLTQHLDLTLKEVTHSFLYNSQGKSQLNIPRVCENFQKKMNSAHRKPKRRLVYEPTPTVLGNGATASSTMDVISQATETPSTSTPASDSTAQRQLQQIELNTMSPTSKKQLFYYSDSFASINSVS